MTVDLPVHGNRVAHAIEDSLLATHDEFDISPQLLRQRLVRAIEGGRELVEASGPRGAPAFELRNAGTLQHR